MTKKNGILIDYEWCTGCHSCEMACQMELELPIGQSGIKVFELGPWKISDDNWQYDFAPVFGDQCTLCEARVAKGALPACVHHCQADCMTFGSIEELSKQLSDHRKQVLYSL